MKIVTARAGWRTTAGALASSLLLSGIGVVASATAVHAAPGFEFTRLAGADRYVTAAAIARDTFTAADNVVLASGSARSFPDALTGNYLAGVGAGPILLTAPHALPQVTSDTLAALRARRVFIVGGTAAVSASVEAGLRDAGYTVERLGGSDRYATARVVAQRLGSVASNIGTPGGSRTAFLGNGQDFPDILAAGPLSWSHQLPLAITRPTALPTATREALRDLRIQRVVIIGGTSAVSSDVEAEVRALSGVTDVRRVFGRDRFGTATAIADFARADLGYDRSHVDLARSDDFADALAGGPHSGRERAPILLTPPTALDETTRSWMAAHSTTLTGGHILGGLTAVIPAVEIAAAAAAGGPEATVTVTSSTVAAGQAITGTVTGDISAVTVSGCGLTDQALGSDTDQATAGRQFRLTVPAGQSAGPCALTFTLTPTGGGAPLTRVVQLSITEVATPTPPTAPAPTTPPPSQPPADTTGPAVTAQPTAPAEGATTVTFTADEPLQEDSISADDITITGSATVQDATVSDRTITVTTTPLAAGDIVTLTAGSVTDLADNTGPAAPVATDPATATEPPTDPRLRARWTMDDDDRTMRDSVGGHDGASTASVLLRQDGLDGFGYQFKDLGSLVTVPDASDLDPDDEPFSVTARVRFSTAPAGHDVDGLDQNTYDIVRKGLGSTPGGDWKLEITSSGAAHCFFRGSAGDAAVVSRTSLADGQWHTITCRRTASEVSLDVDGAVTSAPHSAGTIQSTASVVLGAKSPQGEDQYVGFLDEVSITKG